MQTSWIDHLIRGNFSFLRPSADEIRRVLGPSEKTLPEPQPIFLEDETATPLLGFPILVSRGLQNLEEALEGYLELEEEAQFAFVNRDTFNSRTFASRWERYRGLLAQVLENVAVSSFGQNYPSIFWLYHSHQVARRLRDLPKRILRRDVKVGREHGDEIKYRVVFKYLDRVVSMAQDVAQRLASETEEPEQALFPALLAQMRDNVLILTEEFISPDLTELQGYFQGCLKLDGRELRTRLAALEEWHTRLMSSDPTVRGTARHLLGIDAEPRSAILHPGYASFLRSHPSYAEGHLPSTEQIQVWESLLLKLKEFEILHALRKMVVPLEREGERLVSRDRGLSTTWVAGPPVLYVSQATRPIDFTAAWVVDPVVNRYGLIYDITSFSEIISLLGKMEKTALDAAFRMTFRFQRRVNQLADSLRLKMEKYLGDGAFYSGRNARRTLSVAIHLQRVYRQFLDLGFPFNRGMRIAVNYGQYRLLPLDTGDDHRGPVYEFFGHGLVELSRLATGKATQELDELKTYLISFGYPEATVNKFFAPMLRRNVDLVSKQDEERRFYAYINENGALINEGIVATEPFILRLGDFDPLQYTRDRGRAYIVLTLVEEGGTPLRIGVRKLGFARFKGLDQMPLYEVIDGDEWAVESLKPVPPQKLITALERLFTSAASGRLKRPAAAAGTDLDSTMG